MTVICVCVEIDGAVDDAWDTESGFAMAVPIPEVTTGIDDVVCDELRGVVTETFSGDVRVGRYDVLRGVCNPGEIEAPVPLTVVEIGEVACEVESGVASEAPADRLGIELTACEL